MNSNPCVVIVSSSNTKPKSLIKLITKCTPEENTNRIVQPWKLETKYYTAEINLVGLNQDSDRDEDFNDKVEALIIHMDSNKENGLKDLSKWEALVNDCDPEIKLLVTNYCNNETKISKVHAIDWCLQKGYELIELYPTITEQNDEQSIIEDKVGVDRIVEALQAHVWPNLAMIDEKNKTGNKTEMCDLSEVLTNDGADDFTELFSQLHLMKDSLQSLPLRERKQCAEQMVTAFWKAIGGDEEEIADI